MQTRSRRQRGAANLQPTKLDTTSIRKRKNLPHYTSADASSEKAKLRSLKREQCTVASCTVLSAARSAGALRPVDAPSPDAAAMAALRADGRFDKLIERFGEAGPFPRRDAFDACIRAVVYQQLHGNAARAILARLREKVGAQGNACLVPCDIVHVSVDELRTVGLSRPKATYILECAKRWHGGEFTHSALEAMDDDQVVAALTSMKGYGQWSAQVVMLSALQRTDVMPLGDFALLKGAAVFLGGKPSREKVEVAFKSLSPYRSYASFYLWKLANSSINID
jgi:DNA-3-methyladenine glycosylase II